MLSGTEHFYERFATAIRAVATDGVVVDIGSPARFRKELAAFSTELSRRYYALDYRSGSHGLSDVDIDGDIRVLPLRSNALDGVVCLEVLEHVPEPQRAADEIHRVLKPGGRLVLTVPFMTGYHGKTGAYEDYFRFTHSGLTWLLRRFRRVHVDPLGGVLYRALQGFCPSRLQRLVARRLPMKIFNAVDGRCPTRSPARWLVTAEK